MMDMMALRFHYDYGMRAVKSTIEMCGKLKREADPSRGSIVAQTMYGLSLSLKP